MFRDLIKEIERIDGQTVSVPIETDEKGYIDKQCPNEVCQFIFKVNEEDWANIFKDEAVWCPLCRHEAPSDKWFTFRQVEHAKAEALSFVKGRIGNALRSGAQKFNRMQPKNSFISFSMKVTSTHYRTYVIPAKAAESMQLEIQCEKCNSRFAVIGSAYFCPACGYNSVVRTFNDSLRKICAKKDCVSVVKKAMIESTGKDEAELTCRSLIETCISDGVVAFQKYCEGLYVPYGTPPFNAFQRLDQASQLWKKVVRKGFDSWLTEEDLNLLGILYQKRHLLAHNEGIVDSKYLQKSGDTSYKEGQRIIILPKDVDVLVSLLERLAFEIERACNNK